MIIQGFWMPYEDLNTDLFLYSLTFLNIFAVLVAFFLSVLMRMAKITIENNILSGMNSWGFKNKIPLNEILITRIFSFNGMNGVYVHSTSSSKIYISDATNDFQTLLAIINTNINKDNKVQKLKNKSRRVLIVFSFTLILIVGATAYLMFGNNQSSKFHFIIQNYYMAGLPPEWNLTGERNKRGHLKVSKDFSGIWYMWFKGGSIMVSAEYNNGLKNGSIHIWYKNGKQSALLNFVDNELHGICKKWFDNGKRKEISNYKKVKHHGPFESWYKDGTKKVSAVYKNGLFDGKAKLWYKNGQLSESFNIVDNELNGVQKEWFENGKLKEISNYKNGEFDGVQKEWHENGQLKQTSNYINGELHGLKEDWYKSGKRITLEKWVNGKLDIGKHKSWYENGNIETEIIMNKNFMFKWTSWNEDGSIKTKEYRDNKNLLKKEFFKNNSIDLIETTEIEGRNIVTTTRKGETKELVKKVYFDKNYNFVKRELFKDSKLIKTETQE